MLRIAACTQGEHVPSARFRVRQYRAGLLDRGIELTELVATPGSYPPRGSVPRLGWLPRAVGSAATRARLTHRYAATLLQREMVSTLLTCEPLLKRPLVFDVDDAIWLHRASAVRAIARRSAAVICGNAHIADYFSGWTSRVEVVPTAVDTERFVPGPASGRPRIVWSGTSSNARYVEGIEPALRAVLDACPEAMLRVVSDAPPRLTSLRPEAVEYVAWSPGVEVAALQDATVGIMPLSDDEWVKGKCAFKMLTYLACELPVVVSPVGMNASILEQGSVGFGARSTADWVDALVEVLRGSQESRRRMGRAGRALVEARYSLRAVVPQLAGVLESVVGVAACGRAA